MPTLHFWLLLAPAFILFQSLTGVVCIRIPKENTKLKSKCYINITTDHGVDLHTRGHPPRCISLNHPYCLGLKLPYNATVLPESITDLSLRSSQEVVEYLEQWRGVEKIPHCWPILRVALCSLLMPQCEELDSIVHLHHPSVDICNDLVKSDHCKFVVRHLDGWPSIFNCTDNRVYGKNCSNELRDLRHAELNEQKLSCQYPLVMTSEETNFFRDISGCALSCKYPITNLDEQANINLTISILCLLGLTSTTTALILYSINRASSRPSRMAKVLKRCTICQLLLYIGWSLQLFMDRDIGCRPDGSALYGQPLVANLCVLSFLLTYLPSLSSLLWCAHLGKLFHEKLEGQDKNQDARTKLDRTSSVISYGIPIILFVSVAFMGNIDGHGLYGICTVGQESIVMKSVFVLIPTLLGTIYGNYYFLRIVIKLVSAEDSKLSLSSKRNLIRISALSALTILQIVFTTADYYYEHNNRDMWHGSIEDYVACQLDLKSTSPRVESTHHNTCQLSARPVATLYHLEILSTLGIGLVISSWAYCDSNYRGLRRKFIDLLMDDKERRHRALKYLEQHDHNLPHTSENQPALEQHTECEIQRFDPIDMDIAERDRAIEWNQMTEQAEMVPRPSEQPAPNPLSAAAMQMILFQNAAMMKMQSKMSHHGDTNYDSAPTFTHALSSNPMPVQTDPECNLPRRRPSFGPSEGSSLGSVSIAMNDLNGCESGDSSSTQDNNLSAIKRSKRRLPRKRHHSLKNFRSRHVIRDIKKQRLDQQRQHNGN